MKISVIIPTYRPQSYIWKCLDSLRNQSFQSEHFEIVIILNGCNEPFSTDIKKYLDKYFANYNVSFFQLDQPGVSNARNFAIKQSIGEYIVSYYL